MDEAADLCLASEHLLFDQLGTSVEVSFNQTSVEARTGPGNNICRFLLSRAQASQADLEQQEVKLLYEKEDES